MPGRSSSCRTPSRRYSTTDRPADAVSPSGCAALPSSNTHQSPLSRCSTRGARSLSRAGARSIHRCGGSCTCASASTIGTITSRNVVYVPLLIRGLRSAHRRERGGHDPAVVPVLAELESERLPHRRLVVGLEVLLLPPRVHGVPLLTL